MAWKHLRQVGYKRMLINVQAQNFFLFFIFFDKNVQAPFFFFNKNVQAPERGSSQAMGSTSIYANTLQASFQEVIPMV
jgi:hypothetical protein